MMNYEKLDKDARKTVITRFLERTNDGQGLSNIGTEYTDRFACVLLNGRQVSCLCERADLWLTSGDFQSANTLVGNRYGPELLHLTAISRYICRLYEIEPKFSEFNGGEHSRSLCMYEG
jgi:hypothetical protein